ncbi:hypothetical protein FOL46_004688 [Perkinsus olseni]|uniref:Dynein heavy chain tail domain-containing protein n=1 Tax=Perkinsus olseni TaxID=32597 RepID=A0A7J6LWD3_PEROL|nr:hypothetical protein FOL46_004688 [Perkinsus olseni]
MANYYSLDIAQPDPRKEFIVEACMALLGISQKDRGIFRSNPESNGELEKFLEDLNTKILFAYEQAHETGISGEFRNVCLSTRYEDIPSRLGVAVVFIKIGVGELAAETMSGRVVTTTVDVTHPMRGLRGVLREAYSKLLGDSEVGRSIEELVSGLEACISRGSLSENFDEDNIDNIVIPYDELASWTQHKEAGKESGERVSRIAKELSECRLAAPMLFDNSSPQERGQSSLATLHAAIDGVLPLLENLSLDDKINPAYPVKRMKRLLVVISYKICAEVSWHLAEVKDIFQLKDKGASMVVRESLKVLERWVQCVQDGQLLPESPVESTKGILASPLRLADRIRCVNSLQLQQKQLRSIAADATSPITPAEVQSLIEDVPQADTHSLFGVSDYSEMVWKEFFGRYARKAEPMVLRLKPLIDRQLAAPSGDAASTVASVTGQFGAMLDFPILRENLKSERQTILMMLKRELDEVEDSLGSSRSLGYLEDLHQLAMMRGKVDLMAAGLAPSSAGFLRDLPGASEALSNSRGMSMLIKGRKDTLFKQWCAEMSSNSSVWLDTSASVIKTSSDGGGDLEVTFDSRLLLATKEARAFTNAGYQIPKDLSAKVEAGERYYKYAVSLREVCIFYNQLSLDLLPFQKPMLLTEALAFEELLTKSKMSSWKGVEQLRTFTERAEEGRRRLKSLNDNLRLMHDQILSGIISLCDLSLLRQGERWRSALAELQRKVDIAAEDAGASDKDSSTQLWRAHLDRQLKAVVEIQLIKGLQMFSKTLSDIRVDIMSSGKKVVLKPSVEELRKKYYREVLKFVGRVGKIRGFGGAPGIFRKVCEDSSGVREALVAAYSQAENLFDRLEEERAGVEHWGVIGSVGEQRLAELVEIYDGSGEALWEANLKQMKKKKRELERIPDFVKVDCFTVHMVILKAVVEEQIERFSLEMVISLKRRMNEQIKSLTVQLEVSLGKLTAAPESIREIAVSESEVKKLFAELPSIGRQLEALSERATLIETAGGGAVVGLDRLRELCGAVTVKVESFGTIVEETREKLKSKMSGRVAELKGMVERYASRWQALKPVVEEGDSPFSTAVKEASERMDEWKNDFSGIKTFADALRSDCAEFGMAPPEV